MRSWHVEIDELKLEEFHAGKEDFIRMENDGKSTWKDKDSILSIDELEIKTRLQGKINMGATSQEQDAKT